MAEVDQLKEFVLALWERKKWVVSVNRMMRSG